VTTADRRLPTANRVITSLPEMSALARGLRTQARTVALVPTMGALHEGHLSLVRRAQAEADALVVSIFVNPVQFSPSEDYARYPRDLDRDGRLLAPFAPDAIFAPEARAMYPEGFDTHVEPGRAAAALEGAMRPGHFRGVATVVLKLFNLVAPDLAYFGQKDLQQVAVIRRMVEDFNLGTRVVVCPTVREPDGLALSSRNAYLEAEDRRAAPVLYRSLRAAAERFQAGERRAAALGEAVQTMIAGEPRVRLDYVMVASQDSMQPVEQAASGDAILLAARVGPVRLIDNLILDAA
jgi:pantoate--beta-alanine ligase